MKCRTNDLSQLPVELIDDGVNYGIIYNIKASADVLQAIIVMLEKYCEQAIGDSAENGVNIPMDLILDDDSYNGLLIGYTQESDSLELVTVCRGDVIEPFIDALYGWFPLIDYIEVCN